MIANSLDVARDFYRSDEKSQVASQRLLKSEQPDRALLDLDFKSVDALIVDDHLFGRVAVTLEERFNRLVYQPLRQCGHVDQSLLQLGQLFVKMPVSRCLLRRCHPNLPVMYASVRSSRGRVKIISVGPVSTRRPR